MTPRICDYGYIFAPIGLTKHDATATGIKMYYGAVGDLLTKYRHRSGLTQRQAALKVGNSNSQFISNIERGLCSVPLPMLRKLIRVYGIKEREIPSIIRVLISEFEKRLYESLGVEQKRKQVVYDTTVTTKKRKNKIENKKTDLFSRT